MRAQMDSGVPVLSVVLTPHSYQKTEAHNGIFGAHFVLKGREARTGDRAGANICVA